jgi:hypothetical protein
MVALGLAGCSPASVPLLVQVRDAQTRAPIVGAGVEADSLKLGPSVQFWDAVDEFLGKRDTLESRGITDAKGEAHLAYCPGRSLRVVVLGIGGAPAYLLIERTLETSATEWLLPEQTPEKPATVEVRAGAPERMR